MHRYVPLGDSYTSGEGATTSFPKLLVEHLQKEKIKIELIENPARNGYTTQQILSLELPVLRRNKATFTTLLIGGNDIIQDVPKAVYRKRLREINRNF